MLQEKIDEDISNLIEYFLGKKSAKKEQETIIACFLSHLIV